MDHHSMADLLSEAENLLKAAARVGEIRPRKGGKYYKKVSPDEWREVKRGRIGGQKKAKVPILTPKNELRDRLAQIKKMPLTDSAKAELARKAAAAFRAKKAPVDTKHVQVHARKLQEFAERRSISPGQVGEARQALAAAREQMQPHSQPKPAKVPKPEIAKPLKPMRPTGDKTVAAPPIDWEWPEHNHLRQAVAYVRQHLTPHGPEDQKLRDKAERASRIISAAKVKPNIHPTPKQRERLLMAGYELQPAFEVAQFHASKLKKEEVMALAILMEKYLDTLIGVLEKEMGIQVEKAATPDELSAKAMTQDEHARAADAHRLAGNEAKARAHDAMADKLRVKEGRSWLAAQRRGQSVLTNPPPPPMRAL